jgi:hypothetical protein
MLTVLESVAQYLVAPRFAYATNRESGENDLEAGAAPATVSSERLAYRHWNESGKARVAPEL